MHDYLQVPTTAEKENAVTALISDLRRKSKIRKKENKIKQLFKFVI
jgi:hypothetical protein